MAYGAILGQSPSQALTQSLQQHIANLNNPHQVTTTQIGAATETAFNQHVGNTNNPHQVTTTQIGAIPTSQKGVENGVASLDSTGKVPTSQLPAFSTGGKKYASFVIGNTLGGWTTADCDYLCDGAADQVQINAAITQIINTGRGGEIVFLPGVYNLTNKIQGSGRPIFLRGLGTYGSGSVNFIWYGSYSSNSNPSGGDFNPMLDLPNYSFVSNINFHMGASNITGWSPLANCCILAGVGCNIDRCSFNYAGAGVVVVSTGINTASITKNDFFPTMTCGAFITSNSMVIGNYFHINTGTGIITKTHNGDNVLISNNLIYSNNSDNGILCQNYASHVLIATNILENCSVIDQAVSSSPPVQYGNLIV